MMEALNWNRAEAIAGTAPAKADGATVTIETAAGPLTLQPWADGVFRLTLGAAPADPYGILTMPTPTIDGNATLTGDEAVLHAGNAELRIDTTELSLTLARDGKEVLASADDGHFVRTRRIPPFSKLGERLSIALALRSGEPVYGLGEKWGGLNHRGQLIRSDNWDSLGDNAEISYKNCPFAWSPEGWGMFILSAARTEHGVGFAPWSQRSYIASIEEPPLDFFLIAGTDGADIIERYTGLTGRMPEIPLWSLGIWVSRAYYRTPYEMMEAARTLRDRDLPTDVICLDGRAWQNTDTRFEFAFDPARFNNPKGMCDDVHDLDMKLCVWEYPLVSADGPLFADMEAKGWLLKDETGAAARYEFDSEPFGKVLTQLPESGLVDFTHPDAYEYWRDLHTELFKLGVDVIKPDFGEQVTDNMIAHDGSTGAQLHNVYSLLYNRCVFEATEAAFGKGQAVLFSRSGWAGSQRYPMQWAGDSQADWEGLAAALRGGQSWGMSGVPCYATDIGGFYGPQPSDELFIRWTQAAVFASHMRFHGVGEREPFNFGTETEDIARRFMKLRYRLLPYIDAAIVEAQKTGLPVMRAMALAYPDDRASWAFEDQYMFGPDILVAPVLRAGGSVSYYLPSGRWWNFFTGKAVEGGRAITETVPLEEIPVFVRDGAAVEMGPEVSHTGELGGKIIVDGVLSYGNGELLQRG
ncbi:MAG: glycoside hydrolase family 31 protein [Rhodospirillales bacterium]|jgi:alpha-D-xyloside xylohydrolase|nr:glycoside hydrolase family 31 protein [Rhodospirillales bacterium]